MSVSNMELQAILDAPDSDSSSQEEGDIIADIIPSFAKLQRSAKKEKYNSAEVGYSHDLERILSEHDGDDDEEEEEDSIGFNFGRISPIKRTANVLHNFDFNNADDSYSLGGSTISTRPYLFAPQSPPSMVPKMQESHGISNDQDESAEYSMLNILNPSKGACDDMPRVRANSPIKSARERSESFASNQSCSRSGTVPSRSYQNPEEWAILQKILNEADDDNEDCQSFNMTTAAANESAPSSNQKQTRKDSRELNFTELQRVHSNASSTMDVDAIINSIESDSDDDATDFAELDEMIARFSININKTDAERKNRTRSNVPANPALTWKKQEAAKTRDLETEKYEMGDRYKADLESEKQTATRGKSVTESNVSSSLSKGDAATPYSWTKSKDASINTYLRQYQKGQSKADVATQAALKSAEEYERRLLKPGQRDIVSPLMVKRRMKPKIEMQTKSRKELRPSRKKLIGIASQNAQFDFSGMIESKCMHRISAELQRSMNQESEDLGLPTALSIGSKFIAVGTQRGIVLVFDLFEELRQELGLRSASEASILDQYGSVSSIDIASNGETLVAGYTNGTVILWDIMKGSMVKSVAEIHPSPITVVRFISEKALSIVSVDAGGLVNKLTFVKTMLWSTYSVENECLLDGTAGQILAMDVLSPMSSLKTTPMCITEDKRKQPYHSSIHKLVLIALSSERSSFAIAVEPSISVLHRWSRPSPEQMDVSSFLSDVNSDKNRQSQQASPPPATFLPCLSWGWALVSGGENSVTPILARAWGRCVQLLRANFPPTEDADDGKGDDTILWPAFGVHDEFEATAPVVALKWLGDRSLVFLSMTNELIIVDTVMMTLSERLDFSGMRLVYAEFALSRSAPSDESTNNQCVSTTFQNSIRSSEDRLLVLCQKEVKTLSILGIQQRVTALEELGEWLEALALALDHYEFTIKSQEDRKRNPDGSKDIFDHPAFVSRIRLTEDEEWIGDLLLRYLTLAVDNAPESTFDSKRPNRIDLAQSHYQMLAGVCIEFCVVTRRLDLLFNEIYQCFRNTGYTGVFLDVLEPYVLNDKLKYIAPDVMSEFIDHYKAVGDISTVERCLLHMDVTIMDFDSILSLLRKNFMFSALIHVYTQGLDDYLSPFEILFDACFDAAGLALDDTRHNPKSFILQPSFQRYGYKILLYLRHCLKKKTFPTGRDLLPEDRIVTLRAELLRLLMRTEYKPMKSNMNIIQDSCRTQKFPYIHILMALDGKAFLDTISIVFDDTSVRFADSSDMPETLEKWQNIQDGDSNEQAEDETICPDRMDLVRRIAYVLAIDGTSTSRSVIACESLDDFHDFLSTYLLRGLVRAPPAVICSVISRMSVRSAQEDIIKLFQVLPRNSYCREDVLEVVEANHLSRAALILHKGGVSELFENGTDSTACSNHFMSAIDCYLKDEDLRYQREVFDYIKNECIGGSTAIISYGQNNKEETTVHDVLRNALCQKLPSLINLDPVPCAQLVAEIYVEELEQILSSLSENGDETVLFKFFNAVISGDLVKADAVAGPVLLANMTIDHHQKYLELMAKFHPDMVYQYLTTSDNYRVEECLKLCQEYEIADASAYLLERMGNVSSALQLMLQTLEGRLMTLKRVVRGLNLSSYDNRGKFKFGRNKLNVQTMVTNLHQGKESQAVRQILTFGLDLCERNSGSSSNSEQGSQLWFNVLDRLINAKGFLRLSKELAEHADIMSNVLSDLLRMTMQRMVPNVPVPDLVRKITTDHAGNRLGEFKEMITTMLKTFVSEMDICNGAVNAMRQDVHKLSVSRFSLKVGQCTISTLVDCI